jgi:hypothetical protein
MVRWLFSSSGRPVAFVTDGRVFLRSGRFLGHLEGHEVWHGRYRGEVVFDDRLAFQPGRDGHLPERPIPPGPPGAPGEPASRGAVSLPPGLRDIAADDEPT